MITIDNKTRDEKLQHDIYSKVAKNPDFSSGRIDKI